MTSRPGLISVCQGTEREVLMLHNVAEQFAELEAAPRAALLALMKKHAAGHKLPPTQFKYESRESRGGGKEASVFAFKAFSVRVYGVQLSLDGRAVFVCSELDPAKKQPKADPKKLQRAASNVSDLFEE